MKLLFAHDVKIYKYNDKYFDSSGSFSNEILSRYTDIFEEVRFISRQVRISATSGHLFREHPDSITE